MSILGRMRALRMSRAEPDPGHIRPKWSGPALVDAAASDATREGAFAREVAFAVAQATRDGDAHALPALSALLAGISQEHGFDEGALVNLMSAVQFASMRPDARSDWVPPTAAIARSVELGQSSDELLRDQAEGLLWALVDRRLAAAWLGREGVHALAQGDVSPALRKELLGQVRASDLVSLVSGGEEFPCVTA